MTDTLPWPTRSAVLEKFPSGYSSISSNCWAYCMIGIGTQLSCHMISSCSVSNVCSPCPFGCQRKNFSPGKRTHPSFGSASCLRTLKYSVVTEEAPEIYFVYGQLNVKMQFLYSARSSMWTSSSGFAGFISSGRSTREQSRSPKTNVPGSVAKILRFSSSEKRDYNESFG